MSVTIQQKITSDLKTAMLAKDEAKKSILRVVIGEFSRVTTNADKSVPDDKAIAVLKKMVENATQINNLSEVQILNTYLPKQMSVEELTNVIEKLIASTGATNVREMGKVMAALKPYAGQYDGKSASEIIKTKLA